MKKIIITGGPTNERIDDVTTITNTSDGSAYAVLAEIFAGSGYEVVAILHNSVRIEPRDNLRIVRIENTQDMLNAIESEARQDNTDAIIHSAAVGDYRAGFSFLMEDLADEIFHKIESISSAADILEIMKDPKCKLDPDTRLPRYQENLAMKMELAPRIARKLRFWFPNTLLIGCKTIDSADKGELFDSATAMCNRNHMDYVLVNDLNDSRKGDSSSYIINKDGFTQIVLKNTDAIFRFVDEKLQ